MGTNLQTYTNCQEWSVCHRALIIIIDRTPYGSGDCIFTPPKPPIPNNVP